MQVFILAGQSNMEGQAVVDLAGPDYNGGRGTLAQVLAEPANAVRFRQLRTPEGGWAERADVGVRYARESGPVLRGDLGVGYSVYGDRHHFGPELSFGHVVGDHLPGPVLLVKTAWGGRSLHRDFRPPGAGGTTGPAYVQMLADVRTALARLDAEFPRWAGAGHRLAGFVWYQGWNDGIDPRGAVPEYESNLVHLIRDVRRDLGAPDLPVVVGELTGPWEEAPPEWTALRRAQAAAAARPEFVGSVAFVETRRFVRRPEDSPNPGHGHHEFGNAETCLLVGEALGQAMVRLLGGPEPAEPPIRMVDGWTVHVHPSLWRTQRPATEAALGLLRRQLEEVRRVLPGSVVAWMRTTHLWFSPPYPGIPPRAEYHPGADWLRANRRDPAMVHGIEFTDVPEFAAEMDRMPLFVLHELAHAYHDRVLGFDHAGIRAAYGEAVAGHRYDRVERWLGSGRPTTRERAYALTDPKEYFAESTEAYLGRNDFQPFTRGELESFDPGMFRLLRQVWGEGPAVRP